MEGKSTQLKKTFNRFYLFSSILLLLTVVLACWSIYKLLDRQHMVDHTHLVRYTAEEVISSMKDVETGQRGYALTGDSVYLEPYFQGLTQVKASLSRLQTLTQDNPDQQRRIRFASQLIHASLTLQARLVLWKSQHRTAELNKVFSTHQGKKRMDRVRQAIKTIIRQENALLRERTQQLDRANQYIWFILGSFAVAYLVLAIFSVRLSQKFLLQKQKFEHQLQALNQELAASNEEMATTNEELSASNEELAAASEELKTNNEQLEKIKDELESVIQVRTQELQLNNRQLQQSNTDLDNVIYSASHDLKGPIANLEGLTSRLVTMMNAKLQTDERKLLDMMIQSVIKLRRTINELTEVVKVQKDIHELPMELVSFAELLDELKETVWVEVEQVKGTIAVNLEVETVYYARQHLRSILYNLLSNACKYRSDQRKLEIDVCTFYQQSQLVLVVRDNGLGMQESHVSKLFTMFKRFHTHVEGSGIGLYIIKRMIENHGGRIEVASQPDQGTVFTVYFKSPAMDEGATLM
jgi:signal transduction histidine kinase